MFIATSISVGLVLIILGLSSYRFLIYSRIRQVERSTDLSKKAQVKLRLIKEKEQAKHVQILLINSLLIGLTFLCLAFSAWQTDGEVETLKASSERLNEETYALKQEQKQMITKMPLKDYPEEGIGLKEYSWDQLFEQSETGPLQAEIETKLGQQIVPYFGLSTLILSIDVPTKTLSFSLVGDSGNPPSQETIRSNMTGLVKEAKAIPQVTQIHFQINQTRQGKNPTTYSCTYGRQTEEQDFELLNEEEKDD